MKLFLIRHGESIMNVKQNHDNLPDHKVTLTTKGINQAISAGIGLNQYFEDMNIDKSKTMIINSPYERTRKTAKEVNSFLEVSNQLEDVSIIEHHFGIMDMYTKTEREEVLKEYHSYYRHLCNHDGKYWSQMPHGESIFDVALRVKGFIRDIKEIHKEEGIENFVIVSHGTTVRVIAQEYLRQPYEYALNTPTPENCSIRLIEDKVDKGYIFIPN